MWRRYDCLDAPPAEGRYKGIIITARKLPRSFVRGNHRTVSSTYDEEQQHIRIKDDASHELAGSLYVAIADGNNRSIDIFYTHNLEASSEHIVLLDNQPIK